MGSELKGISRIDSATTHGWMVRAYKNGKTHSKLFSDRKCGGRDQALLKAQAYRDKLQAKLEKIPKKRLKRRIVTSDSRNKSGILGVCRIGRKSSNGKINEVFTVHWRPKPGVQKCSAFAIRKYGEEQAFHKAIELRLKMTKKHLGAEVAAGEAEQAREHFKAQGKPMPDFLQ